MVSLLTTPLMMMTGAFDMASSPGKEQLRMARVNSLCNALSKKQSALAMSRAGLFRERLGKTPMPRRAKHHAYDAPCQGQARLLTFDGDFQGIVVYKW